MFRKFTVNSDRFKRIYSVCRNSVQGIATNEWTACLSRPLSFPFLSEIELFPNKCRQRPKLNTLSPGNDLTLFGILFSSGTDDHLPEKGLTPRLPERCV